MSKTLVVYHDPCDDGFGAAWVASKKLGTQDVVYRGAKYGDPKALTTADAAQYDRIYMLDFTLNSRESMDAIAMVTNLKVIDHHKSAAALLSGAPYAMFDMNHSGTILTYKHFFPDNTPFPFILHIEDRDLWRFKMEGTKEFTAALRSYPRTFKQWDRLEWLVKPLKAEGQAILRAVNKQVEDILAAGGSQDGFFGYPSVNSPIHQSELAHALLERNPDAEFASVFYALPDGRINVSLRSRDTFDVSRLAAHFGGGGHKNAAGFICKPKRLSRGEVVAAIATCYQGREE